LSLLPPCSEAAPATAPSFGSGYIAVGDRDAAFGTFGVAEGQGDDFTAIATHDASSLFPHGRTTLAARLACRNACPLFGHIDLGRLSSDSGLCAATWSVSCRTLRARQRPLFLVASLFTAATGELAIAAFDDSEETELPLRIGTRC
jgi:hypothetical protein